MTKYTIRVGVPCGTKFGQSVAWKMFDMRFFSKPRQQKVLSQEVTLLLNSVESFAWLVVILIVAQLVWFAARQMLAQSASSLPPGLSIQQGLR